MSQGEEVISRLAIPLAVTDGQIVIFANELVFGIVGLPPWVLQIIYQQGMLFAEAEQWRRWNCLSPPDAIRFFDHSAEAFMNLHVLITSGSNDEPRP